MKASTVSPSASPLSPASASPPPSRDRTASESLNRHSPPNNSTCTSGSANGVRPVYTSGRHAASTSPPATACHAPHSRPTSPPNDSRAHLPTTAGTSSLWVRPPSHAPPASTSGSPGTNPGVTELPATVNPAGANARPGAPPKEAADSGIRAIPCAAIQYPYCR